jgi:catechol 2,3-dioxygenase-like lactoylglutathione lyase family enzyme
VRVNRIIPNLKVRDTAAANRFYSDALGLSVSGDFGWVGFLTAPERPGVELHTVTSDATAPVDSVVSVGVDDVDAAYQRVRDAGAEIVYPLQDEEWGVRRFFFRDPDGNVVNVVAHRPVTATTSSPPPDSHDPR